MEKVDNPEAESESVPDLPWAHLVPHAWDALA
jgi:hypothetical protein